MKSFLLVPHSTVFPVMPLSSLMLVDGPASQTRKLLSAELSAHGKKSALADTLAPDPIDQSDGPLLSPHQLRVTSIGVLVLLTTPAPELPERSLNVALRCGTVVPIPSVSTSI